VQSEVLLGPADQKQTFPLHLSDKGTEAEVDQNWVWPLLAKNVKETAYDPESRNFSSNYTPTVARVSSREPLTAARASRALASFFERSWKSSSSTYIKQETEKHVGGKLSETAPE